MATFNISWRFDNLIGTTGYKVWYRPANTSLWTTTITSGTSYSIGGLINNYIYDTQIQMLNSAQENPLTPIQQAVGITDPLPILSPTNTSISFSFNNLSSYMTGYTVSIALRSFPATIIESQEFGAIPTITGIFTGLTNSTAYIITIQPVAGQFSATFTYPVVTENSATCAAPINIYATLTSGTPIINLFWGSPAIPPIGGYLVSYRRKGDPSYNTLLTSGLTSGNTIGIPLKSIANYEGYMNSECGGENISNNIPFGINATDIPTISISVQPSPLAYIAIVNSVYPNPYSTVISGTFISSIVGTVSYTLTYPANVRSANIVLTNTPMSSNEVISNVIISAISPNFNNGGSLQQFDNVNTPPYFQFITSGTVWNGNPIRLSSFTLDEFIPTEQDISGNVLMGTLNMSWIYDSIYNNTTSIPYNTVTFQVQDPSNSAVMGIVTTVTGILGTNISSIVLSKQITNITPNNSFNIIAIWSNGYAIESAIPFNLPTFVP